MLAVAVSEKKNNPGVVLRPRWKKWIKRAASFIVLPSAVAMNVASLQKVALALAESQTVDSVLQIIVGALAEQDWGHGTARSLQSWLAPDRRCL